MNISSLTGRDKIKKSFKAGSFPRDWSWLDGFWCSLYVSSLSAGWLPAEMSELNIRFSFFHPSDISIPDKRLQRNWVTRKSEAGTQVLFVIFTFNSCSGKQRREDGKGLHTSLWDVIFSWNVLFLMIWSLWLQPVKNIWQSFQQWAGTSHGYGTEKSANHAGRNSNAVRGKSGASFDSSQPWLI